MNIYTLQLTGRIPSKKNSKNIFRAGNKVFISTSKAYKDWHEEKMWELKTQPKCKFSNILEIVINFQFADNRRCDLTNKAESIMDLLVDMKIISDDSWQVVPRMTLCINPIDTVNKNPTTTIIIKGR